jgi:hypothetical protein
MLSASNRALYESLKHEYFYYDPLAHDNSMSCVFPEEKLMLLADLSFDSDDDDELHTVFSYALSLKRRVAYFYYRIFAKGVELWRPGFESERIWQGGINCNHDLDTLPHDLFAFLSPSEVPTKTRERRH